ncbi:MAG: SanA/YdcF family protein [Minisyncoccia bacterium]
MIKFTRRFIGVILIGGIFFITYTNATVNHNSTPFIFKDVEKLQEHKVGLVLGTSAKTVGGGENPFFISRIEAATKLYQAGKIKKILVSGDNADISYNEPKAMQIALLERGIPKENIVLDYAGFRTLDSVIRARDVFGQNDLVIISQEFHIKRAVYIARTLGIDAQGFVAEEVSMKFNARSQVREILARTQAWMDVHILSRQPKFLGEKEEII